MVFNSYLFIFIFLPFCLLGYFILNRKKCYKISEHFLILMSFWFYGYFNYKYLFIIIGSIFVNFFLGKYIRKSNGKISKKLLLILGCLLNVGVLFYFKYMDFFIENINTIFKTSFELKNLILPLGISFFTFQQLSFVIDCYKGNMKDYSFRQYALFVVFFPQLIAGPIVLHNETIPQFEDVKKKEFCWENFSKGLMAFAFGMAKKVLIADNLGKVVTYGFSNIVGLGTTSAIYVMLSYTFQIYFDFSGYCDMATGIAKMFNIDLPMNFNSPYKSLSVTEFWKKWHITLSRFLRIYVYFPLGGNIKGKIRTYINLFIVFLISGLWHGANYTFIVWGIMHGVMMVIERIFKNKIENVNSTFRWIVTFVFINITWIFFRANNIEDAILFIKEILYFKFTPINVNLIKQFDFDIIPFVLNYLGKYGVYLKSTYHIYIILFTFTITLVCKNTNQRLENFKPTIRNAILSSIFLFLSIISFTGISVFLYYNF